MKIAVKYQHLHVLFDNDIEYNCFYLLDLLSKTLNYIVLPPVKTILLYRGHKNDSETFHQKMIYILQVCGIPFGEKFHYHFYGPYSEELSLRVEELCNLGFLKEDREDKSNYIQYHYQITREGVDFLQQFSLEMPEMSQKIGLLQQQSARFLELVATMLYFKDDLPPNE